MKTAVFAMVALSLACASSGRRTTHTVLPPRDRGCEVEVATESPSRAVQGLGDVTARCTDEMANDPAGCRRVLQDQVCALGGDVLWGVTSDRSDDGLRMRAYAGRYR